jgi:Hsp20/alpha crystallin family protein
MGRVALDKPALRAQPEEEFTFTKWLPPVDIEENDREYLVKAELPGMKKEEVKLKVEGGTLSISGERKAEKEEKDKKCRVSGARSVSISSEMRSRRWFRPSSASHFVYILKIARLFRASLAREPSNQQHLDQLSKNHIASQSRDQEWPVEPGK